MDVNDIGSMYFVNENGTTPTLYLPSEGYLENGCVSGARWYPFPERYFYTRPVYLGQALKRVVRIADYRWSLEAHTANVLRQAEAPAAKASGPMAATKVTVRCGAR